MKVKIYIFAMALLATLNASAQSATYIHDATKMNQFLMQETGEGHFVGTSEWYYTLFHNSYRQSLLATNKNIYRTATYEASYQQVDYADSIRKRLESRAKVEALNVADRELDLAWVTEQSKIEGALSKYRNNVSLIRVYGATEEEKEDWEQYAKMWDFAIDRTRNAYMANSERQKEFLTIYDDITKRNILLKQRMRYLKALSKSNEMLNAQKSYRRRVQEATTASYNKWRENAWTVKVKNSHTN